MHPNHFPRVGMGPSHILKEERRERMSLDQVCDGADQGVGDVAFSCLFLLIFARGLGREHPKSPLETTQSSQSICPEV